MPRKYEKKDTHICVWCNEHYETNHQNSTTCGQRCRSRLKWYRDYTGFDPEEPPGKMTAHEAVKQLVGMLLAAERKRRMYLAMLREQERTTVRDAAIRKLNDEDPRHL